LAELHFQPALFSAALLDWYACRGRALPWRNTRDPYPIWLAEIMLQQTTVAAVIDYFQRFTERWPTLETLAAATTEEVVEQWAGLGYYSRARNLHRAAQRIVSEYAGEFPQGVTELQALPGIGRSTAGAVAALAFDQRAPILDGNVRRVLCRIMALQQPPRSTAAEKLLWVWSEQLTPVEHVHDYTQAIMDLGATVCTPRSPRCAECPVVELCRAHELDLVEQLPFKQKGKKIPLRREVALLIEDRGRIFVRRRALDGFLGGLWEFPGCSLSEDEQPQQKLAWLAAELAVDRSADGEFEAIAEIEHVYSHFKLQVGAYRLKSMNSGVAESAGRWLAPEELLELALHGAHKKILPHIHES
jgi:A/G-specific adenine glycosylase